jgi:hypothetical protein
MNGLSGSYPGRAPWSVDEICFQDLVRDEVREDRQLFYVLTAASFVEITSDLFTDNLVEFYRGDNEVTAWLSQQWESEELRHGAVLKRYVETAWPEFDWNAGYRGFFAEYARCCAVDLLAATPALELVARCVVETGTATFYRAVSEATAEPVLKQIASNISIDEVRHYKHFYHFFLRYQDRGWTSRFAILRTLWRRAIEVDTEDAFLAFKHVFLVSNPRTEFHLSDYRAFRAGVRRLARGHYPLEMAVRMMLQPLRLSPPVIRAVVPSVVSVARFLFLR